MSAQATTIHPASTGSRKTDQLGPSRGGLLRSLVTPTLLVGVLLLVHGFRDLGDATLGQRMLGATLGVVAIMGAWRYLRLGLFHRLPILEFALFQTYIFFGLPTVTGALSRTHTVSSGGVTRALIACLLFVACLLPGAWLGAYPGKHATKVLGRLFPKVLPAGARRTVPFWLGIAAVLNTPIAKLAPEAAYYPMAVLNASLVPSLLWYIAMPGGKNDSQGQPRMTGLLSVATVLGVAGMITGMLTAVLTPLLYAFVVALIVRRDPPARWAAGAILLFVLLNPAKHAFRKSQDWGKAEKGNAGLTKQYKVVGPGEAVRTWYDAIEQSWFEQTADATESNTDQALDRLNYLTTVARTIDFTGGIVPYERGARWTAILQAPIPRFINPEKPNFTSLFNDHFSVLFGIQTERNARTTTVALPVISDGYWNFGWVGVVMVGVFVGLYLGFVGSLWLPDHWGLGALALVFFGQMNVVDPLYGFAGGVSQQFLGLIAATWGIFFISRVLTKDTSPVRLSNKGSRRAR